MSPLVEVEGAAKGIPRPTADCVSGRAAAMQFEMEDRSENGRVSRWHAFPDETPGV